VCADFTPNSRRKFEVAAGKPAATQPKVTVKKEGDHYVLENETMAIRVPAQGGGAQPPGPVAGMKLAGAWVGGSAWKTPVALKRFAATVVGDGTIFGKVRMRYEFEGLAGLNGDVPAFAEVDVRLGPGWKHAELTERHEMPRGSYWELDASAGWKPTQGIARPFSSGFQPAPPPPNVRPLKPVVHPHFREDMFINLFPRWNQGCKDGWYFAASDGANMFQAMVVRASQWEWPHPNAIEVIVRESGDYAGLRAPTWKGRRVWWLLTAPHSTDDAEKAYQGYVYRHAFEHLDKLNHEVISDWADGQEAGWGGPWAFGGINPTGGLRGEGKGAVNNAGKPSGYGTLARMQSMMHPDVYGNYYLYWSPENPNFATDFFKPPIAYATNLKAHPRFKELARQAELKFKEDLYHSITLPGGAGQECPGYVLHASHTWEELARVCRDHLGFDASKWERMHAYHRFLRRISQPDGNPQENPPTPKDGEAYDGPPCVRRKWLRIGDTHGKPPMYVPVNEVKGWKSEELPGFGAILNSRPGEPDETYLSFKSGPNRGHFHGDQLSFHFCADGKAAVVDHQCSYSPHAGQEHMHNRVAFHTDAFPYMNMDGYERLIAFKPSADVDLAVGQVESERLREVNEKPPCNWHNEYPQVRFAQPLIYRRTIVLVKNGPRDYVVFRDQFWAPRELSAVFCAHALSDKCERKGQTIEWGNVSLFCAEPKEFEFGRLDFSHNNGGPETTAGARLTVKASKGQFVTVLYPGALPAVSAIPGGVKVGDDEIVFSGDEPSAGDDATYAVVRRGGKEVAQLTGKDLNLDRSQGEVGLFVPDAGYPFGEIPDWLIRQRAKIAPWALKTDAELAQGK
jgi:hypothetical protein